MNREEITNKIRDAVISCPFGGIYRTGLAMGMARAYNDAGKIGTDDVLEVTFKALEGLVEWED